MVQCEAMFWGPRHAQAGDSPELRTLLFRLAYLLRCTVIPVFVFDGALRPGIKRGKKVRTRAPWLEKHFKEMIRAFGFYYHDAPGEAEAELATMNKAGIIDMIITEDSDALVFGGMCILRRVEVISLLYRPPRSKGDNGKKIKIDPDEYVLYSSKHILAQDNVRLTEGGLFLLAILLGGDYDGNKGLSGCGQKTAHMLALTGLGDSLYLAVKTMDNSELQKYLTVWRDMLRSELLQPSIPGASKHPSLANKIPVAFPNMKILKYYAQPITSWHAGFEQRVVASAWEVPLPDIALISDFCSRFFHWDSDVLLQRLRKNIWPGIIVQSLYRVRQIYSFWLWCSLSEAR
ncbi:PIN domain-like protein [Armillaria novae-zelandiae]|uniref:PIN domain-like protein n=1 Tax=Armillaria novae-zelandiae TaxID=153914 RepID=A0AA39NTP4_9AGAR|nr:PIN domain-like protein [Armillaria novae-zelandiae]